MRVSAEDAEYVRDIVRKRSAIALDASKDYLIETRLAGLVRQHNMKSLEELVSRARTGEPHLHTQIVEAITTHETSFFRDNKPFELLRHDVLPSLIAARSTTKSLTIWSAACSSGQEAYSIGILLLEHFPQLASWNIRIVATDISEQVLARAREGLFNQIEINRGLPVALLMKYFKREGMNYRIGDNVRRFVDFRQGNLLDVASLKMRPDIVFLRNVLIYFEVDVKRTIIGSVRKLIAPDGALFLGSAETMMNVAEGWTANTKEHSTFYRVQR